MENKKISFGFTKTTKTALTPKPLSNSLKDKQIIECIEQQSIKIKEFPINAVHIEDKPLIIPISTKKSNLLDRVREAVEKRTKLEEKPEKPDSELTLDELAARELIREAQNRTTLATAPKVHSLPLKGEDKFVAEGEESATLEDYENVPISEYGLAMLRGMGWQEGMSIGKKNAKVAPPPLPELRPKGLGLGATKMVNSAKPKESVDKNGKTLELLKGSCGKIIAGGHKGQYCEVLGFDDENCRIIVKTAMTNNVLTLNEFLLVPVTKEEYALGSKVLNNAKYEEYKEKSDFKLKGESSKRRSRSRSRSRDRKREESDSDDYKRRKDKKHKHKKSHKNKHKKERR